jgi:hypothetical protein
VAGGGHGGGVRPSDGGGTCSVSVWGGRRRSTRPGGPKGRVGWLVAGPIEPEAEQNPFRIKIGFLNLPRIWKFVQGNFEGIWRQELFLNSSRLLKDF